MTEQSQHLVITQPDDWHIHLRDGELLTHTVAAVSRTFRRCIVMPNLSPPMVNCEQVLRYRERILAAVSPAAEKPELEAKPEFEPLMTLYLTDQTSVDEIVKAAANPYIHAAKLYPAGATTNSASGVTDINAIYKVLEAMQSNDLPLLIHGEVVNDDIDVFDREAIFIDRYLYQLTKDFPQLRIVFEHITTADAVDFVQSSSARIGATITPQHLLYNRNHMLVGGIKPHYFCLPILKRDRHQQALVAAATSGNPRFFLGSDSAPHSRQSKETDCGCAGCYSAGHTLELYATVFEQAGALDKLEGFASHFGADFYQLPRNNNRVRLQRRSQLVPAQLPLGNDQVVPLMAGQTLDWSVEAVI